MHAVYDVQSSNESALRAARSPATSITSWHTVNSENRTTKGVPLLRPRDLSEPS